MTTSNDPQPRTRWESMFAFLFGTIQSLGRGAKWFLTSVASLVAAGMVAAAFLGIAGVGMLVGPFLLFGWGWMAAGPLFPRDPLAGLLVTAVGACGAAIVTLPWRPVEAFVSWMLSPLRRGAPPPTWLSDASRSVNAFVLLFGSLVCLAHLSGYLIGFDSYVVRVVLFIGMMMTSGFVNLGERNRLSAELLAIARTNVRAFSALSVALIVGSLTVGSYLSAFGQGTRFVVRVESATVRLSNGSDRAVRVLPTPSGGFFLVDDVFGPFAADRIEPGGELRLAAGIELVLPGYAETPVPSDDGTSGWKIRRAWWLARETRAAGAPVEYDSLSDPSLVARLSPSIAASYSVAPSYAPVPVLPAATVTPPSTTKPVACEDLPESYRSRFCKTSSKPSSR